MGADSACLDGDSTRLSVLSTPKVFQLGQFVIGYAGMLRVGLVLRYKFTPPKHTRKLRVEEYVQTVFIDAVRKAMLEAGIAEKHDNVESIESDFLVGYRGRLFSVDGAYAVSESERPYDAVGCGAPVALGALSVTTKLPPKQRLLLALRAAQDYDSGVRGPFRIVGPKETKPTL